MTESAARVAARTLRASQVPTEENPEGQTLQVYTVKQVAEILQVGRDQVFALLRTGRLRSIKIGRLRRITAQQLADFVASVEE
ncbi:helix-turn-helix domain-containing protein [Actinomadura sp. NTSP31]|uniref:helix-turn-helix domain-containing protein n=1 Tax=Actinomadura sp. NTSP31 TaxID=1735447 RepID=UPI0035BFBDAC